MIAPANTVIEPQTMVIHPLDTCIALAAVSYPWLFEVVAFLAILDLLGEEVQLEGSGLG